MSFTTGAALLDAVVLAIVSKEPEAHMVIRSPRRSNRHWT